MLGAILALAFILRLRGITWGLPGVPYFILYHPDEWTSLQCLFGMKPAAFDFNPHYFVNPTLYYYCAGAVLKVLSIVNHAVVSPFGPGRLSIVQLGGLLLGARALTVVVGVLTVCIVYKAGRRLYDRPVGLLSALFLSVIPVHVVHSHYFTVNVAGTFWVALILLLSERIRGSGERRWYLLAGLTIGLATATKYFGLLLVVPALTAHFLRRRVSGGSRRGRSLNVLLLLGAIIIAFVAGCPYSVLAPEEFGKDFYEMIRFNQFPPSFDRLIANMYYSLGPTALIFSLICVVTLLIERRPQDYILLSFFFFFIVASWYRASHFTRHFLFVTPVLAIIAGRGIEIGWGRWRNILWRCAVIVICVLVVIHTALYSWKYLTVMAGEDPRDECVGWLAANMEPGAKVGLFSPPWFFTPPFDTAVYPSIVIHRDIASLKRESPACFIITGFEYNWFTHVNCGAGIYIRKDFRKGLADTKLFADRDLPAAGYERSAVFSRDVKPPGFGWCKLRVPHDWEYPAPEIMLFVRSDPGGL